MNEEDAIRNLAAGMVSVLQWVEAHHTLHSEHIDQVRTQSLRNTKTRFRSIYRRPWRFKLPVVAKSAHETLEWVAKTFSEEDN